jgi:hypothetical protein
MRIRLLTLVIPLCAIVSGCATFTPVAVSPAEALKNPPSHLQVITRDGQRVEMHHTRVQGDSLVGWSRQRRMGPADRQVPLVDIVELRQPGPPDAGKAGRVVLTAVTASAAALVLFVLIGYRYLGFGGC